MTHEAKENGQPESGRRDAEAYFALGLVFFLAGAAFLIGDGTRAVSLAMLPLGTIFMALGAGKKWRDQRSETTPDSERDDGDSDGSGGPEGGSSGGGSAGR